MRTPSEIERRLLEDGRGKSTPHCRNAVPSRGCYEGDDDTAIREMMKLGWVEIVRCNQGHNHLRVTHAGEQALYLQDIANGKVQP